MNIKFMASDLVDMKLKPKEAAFVIEYMKDFNARRAAETVGYSPDTGYSLLTRDGIIKAIEYITQQCMKKAEIDATWVLLELVDNHHIARYQGNISASNTALLTIAKHAAVDALANQKVDLSVVSDDELAERLKRGRQRLAYQGVNTPSDSDGQDEEVSFL